MVRVFQSMYWVAEVGVFLRQIYSPALPSFSFNQYMQVPHNLCGLPTLYWRALLRPPSYVSALLMSREACFTSLWDISDRAGSLVCKLNLTRFRGHLCAARRGRLKRLGGLDRKPARTQQVGVSRWSQQETLSRP